jgi:hypothetical protein
MFKANSYKCIKKLSATFGGIVLLVFLFSCNPTKYVPKEKLLLNDVTIKCDNSSIDLYELESYIKQKPNRKMLHMKFKMGKSHRSVPRRKISFGIVQYG